MIHCTEQRCGRMFIKGEKCPSCGSTNVRPNVVEGTVIIVTIHSNEGALYPRHTKEENINAT